MHEKCWVVQHNKLIEARYKLTVEEQRLIKTLVARIKPEDEDFKVYEIRILDLARLVGITDDYYYNKIRKLTKKLRSNSLAFVNDNGDEIQTGWLSSAVYRKGKGCVELRFDPVLKPYLLQLKKLFTSYELGNVLRLKGIHSIRIYELLKQYQKLGVRDLDLHALKRMLQLESEYPEYRDFKRYVLIPAKTEISRRTDITCSFSERKQGRKVVGLTFHIAANDADACTNQNQEGGITDDSDSKVQEMPHLLEQLIAVGVTTSMAETIIKDYDEERIMAAIAYMATQHKKGKIKNAAGFVIEAIKQEYRNSLAEERERQEQKRKAGEDKEKQAQEIKKQASRLRRQAIEGFLASCTQDQVKRLEAEFIEAYKDNTALVQRYRKQGVDSAMVRGCFNDFVFRTRLSGF